jgi:hypothetical protein
LIDTRSLFQQHGHPNPAVPRKREPILFPLTNLGIFNNENHQESDH